MHKSKGEIEDRISKALTQWEKEYLGRGSVSVKTDILRNMIIVLLKGVLTPAEQNLAKTFEGMMSVKKTRSDLVESGSDYLKQLVESISGSKVVSFHTDVSTRTGERVMVFILSDNLEDQLDSGR